MQKPVGASFGQSEQGAGAVKEPPPCRRFIARHHRLSSRMTHQVRWPQSAAMADWPSPLLGGCDGGEVGNKAAHGTQRPFGGSGAFLDDRVKGDGPVERELNLSRSPQTLQVRATADPLSQVVRQGTHVEPARARQPHLRQAIETVSRLRALTWTSTGVMSTGFPARASLYAGLPPTFFAENAGGVCM